MKIRVIDWSCLLCLCMTLFISQRSAAQQPARIPFGIGQGQGQGPGNQQGAQRGGGPAGNLFGSDGGAQAADFESLMELITSTVDADTWMENGTGDGEIQPFPTGVYADASGTLRFAGNRSSSAIASISLSEVPQNINDAAEQDVHSESTLRFVSLPRLQAVIRDRQVAHQPLEEAMLTLAGLQRVQYVFVVPPIGDAPGDLILAGPAGNWQVRLDGKIVATTTGQPVVRLDDLITLWRRHLVREGKAFGVSINPRQANLAKVQQYVQASSTRPLEPGQRGEWLTGLRDSLGKQDVEFFGLEPDSHVARVLLVADYHMKLIGMGLAESVDGVVSYLQSVQVGADGSVPPMTVLRWWFALNYDPVETNDERTIFALRGPGARVLSENEMLAARGQRVHTGQSEDLNKQFADSFTQQFEAISARYPLYTELRNVFDLTMVLALIDREGLLARAQWHPTLFANADWLPLPRMSVPAEVETVINHRVVRRKHIIAGISGGVWADSRNSLNIVSNSSNLPSPKQPAKSEQRELVWWWD